MSPSKRHGTRSSIRNNDIAPHSKTNSDVKIPKLRKLPKAKKVKQGILADTTNSISSHRMSLRSRVGARINSKKRQLTSECNIDEKSSSSVSSSSYFCPEEHAISDQSHAQSPESPTKKRPINKDEPQVEELDILPTPRCLDFSLFMCFDGNGDILGEILSYFFSPFHPTGNEALDLLRDTICFDEFAASFLTCKSFAQSIERTMASLLIPSMGVSFEQLTPKFTYSVPKMPYPNTAHFLSYPERRIRSFTAVDALGRKCLDDLFTNPVFCVRYKGVRQGNKLHSALESTAGQWPLQLQTFFKMRTYTKFDRLMNVYALRSYLPLPWLDFQVSDRFYKRKKKPILKEGDTIKSTHNLWTIGMEPKRVDDSTPEDEEARTDEDPDIWVDSYLSCAEDECFVYIRDCRRIANIEPLRISWPPRCEQGACEGALIGDGTESGAFGQCGRFVQGDQSTNSSMNLNIDEPGQPVRPRHFGWMFKVKQSAPLEPIMRRVIHETQHCLYRVENVDNQSPTEFRSVATTSFGEERQVVADGGDSAPQATAKAIWGVLSNPPPCNLPIHLLDLRDVSTSITQTVEESSNSIIADAE